MVLGIKKVKRLGRFEKSYNKLNKQNKEAVKVAVNELKNCDELPASRRLKKVKSRKNAWAIRVSRGIRLTFEVEGETCILRNVGDHDKTLDDA